MYSFDEIQRLVAEGLEAMKIEREPKTLYAPIDYVLDLGGKRIRPVLLLATYNMYQKDVRAALLPALGVEVYHNFTLLHDDLMDRADVRRGMPTVHKKWSDNVAILSGDNMLVMAMQLVASCHLERTLDVARFFVQTTIQINEGQQFDMDFETRSDVTEAEYLEMIRLKTSVLLACALKMGAMLGGASADDCEKLYSFGESLGMAFQLQDDYLDVYGDYETFGKRIGGDILCNKKTYMLINALLRANDVQREELAYWLEAENPNPEEKIAAVTELYDEIGIPALAQARIDEYFQAAMRCLERVNVSADKKVVLMEMAHRLMNRKS